MLPLSLRSVPLNDHISLPKLSLQGFKDEIAYPVNILSECWLLTLIVVMNNNAYYMFRLVGFAMNTYATKNPGAILAC